MTTTTSTSRPSCGTDRTVPLIVTARVRFVTTTRAGGVSAPPYDSFNLAYHVGDDPAAVTVNRERLAAGIGLPTAHVVWMNQVHGTHVEVVGAPRDPAAGEFEDTDALVTAVPGLALAVISGDCVPVLLADARAGVIAAAHAGRVGAAAGIVLRTLEAMLGLGARAEDISAVLGPAVSGRNYEVPDQMAAEVEVRLPGSRTTTASGTPGLDLRAGIARQLLAAGVGAVEIDPRCTVEDPDLFSHRRDNPTGRMASLVWIEPS
jgi:YfiH family protein